METNCMFLMDYSKQLLEATIVNYKLSYIKNEEEIDKLRKDFVKYVKDKLSVDDKEIMDGVSPKKIREKNFKYTKEIWASTKARLDLEFHNIKKNKIALPYATRDLIRYDAFKERDVYVDFLIKKRFSFV